MPHSTQRYSRFGINELSTAATVAPVTLNEIKDNTPSIFDNSQDAYIECDILPVAIEFVEQRAGRSLITQTRIQYHDDFFDVFYLQFAPVSAITSVQYVDTTGTSQTVASTVYRLDSKSKPARLTEELNQTWPTAADVSNAVTITYTAGYGSAASSVPIIYRRAIIALATFWIENPAALACQDAGVMTANLDALIATEGMMPTYA